MNIVDAETENRLLKDLQEVNIFDRQFEKNIVKSGNNFCSEASRFTLRYYKNGEKCEKSFFVKVPYNAPIYQYMKNFDVYAKEVYMYKAVLPLYRSLLAHESIIPQFYATDGKEALILEDLSKCGYRVQERHKQLDFEHCAAAMKLLAKFHAVGVKINETQPRLLDAVRKESLLTSALLSLEEYCEMLKSRFSKVISRAQPAYASQHPEVLQFFHDNAIRMLVADAKADENSFNVLNHGDFQTNNVMFAYDACDQVKDAKCIDFQLCAWSSPVKDIMYFAINSIRPEIFEKYFNLLLEIYTTTLNATLNFLQCDKRLDIEDLKKEIWKKGAFLHYVLIGITPIIVSDPLNNYDDVTNEKFLDEEYYIELTKFWISNFIKEGVYSKYEDAAIAVDKFIRKFTAENGVSISKYDLEYDVIKPGENFCSGITRLRFQYHDKDEEEAISSTVLLKIPSLSVNYGDMKAVGIYHQEIFVYETLLPELYELWIEGDRFFPHCHLVTPSGVLVLEDLTTQGFRTCDKVGQLDFDHCRLALVTLAKYHATSVKYLQNCDRNSSLHASIIEGLKFPSALDALDQTLTRRFLHVAESITSPTTYEKLKAYEKMLPELQNRLEKSGTSSFQVIGHGDYWTNNILFKYDDDGRPQQVKMIDWQVCRKSSPVTDLIYFFVTSTRFEVFEARRDELLNSYLDALNRTMATLTCDCAYTRAQLDKDMDECKFLYVSFLGTVLQIILEEKAISFSKITPSEINSRYYQLTAQKWLNYLEVNNLV